MPHWFPPLSSKQMLVGGTSGLQPPGSPTFVLLHASDVGKQALFSNCMRCLLGQHYESQDNEMLHVASKPQSPGGSGEKRILGQWGVTRWCINFYHFKAQTCTSPVTTDVVLSVHQIDSCDPILQSILLSDLPLCLFLGEHFSDAEKLSSLVVCGSYSVYTSPPSSGYTLANTFAWSFLTVRKTSPKSILIEGYHLGVKM